MINKIYLEDHNQVLTDIKGSFEIVDNWMEAEAVVVWQDVRGETAQIVSNANLLGIPTVVMQHGLRASRDYDINNKKMLVAKKIMVWGEKDRDRILETGWVENERITVTGTTIFDHLGSKIEHEGNNVLFVPLHWDREIEENFEAAEALNKIKGVNVKTKVIEGQDVSHYQNVVYSHRDTKDHLATIASLLARTDVLVSINESTLEFMAYYMDIPVITVDNWRPKKMLDTWVESIDKDFSQAAIRSNINELEKTIEKVLGDKGIKRNERKEALRLEAGVGVDKISPKEKIIEAIKNLDQDLY